MDGATLDGVAGAELAPRWFRRDQQVVCIVGETRSGAVTIANTPPEAHGVVLEIEMPPSDERSRGRWTAVGEAKSRPWADDREGQQGVVAVPVGFFDVDGDQQRWRLRWMLDGEPWGTEERMELPESRSASGKHVLTVEAVPSDGEVDGEVVRATLTLAYRE